MPIDRIQRVNEMIRRELATALYHVGQGEEVDTASISFMDVSTSRDLRGAVVYVSFLGDAVRHGDLLRWLRRHRVDFQAHVASSLQLKYTPKLMFRQTTAVEQGNRVLHILADLKADEDSTAEGRGGAVADAEVP